MAQEPNHIDVVIANLEDWQERITGAIEILRALSTHGGAVPAGTPVSNPRMMSSEISHDAFFQMTVPDAAEKYLKLVKKTKPNPELADALLKGGLKSSAKNFPEMIRTVLNREPRFVKVNSEWGLTEWYPGMRKERKPKPILPSSTTEHAVKDNPPQESDASEKILSAMRANPSGEWTATKLSANTGLKLKTVQGTIFRLRLKDKITNRVDGIGYVLK